jgi:hypothetical protein
MCKFTILARWPLAGFYPPSPINFHNNFFLRECRVKNRRKKLRGCRGHGAALSCTHLSMDPANRTIDTRIFSPRAVSGLCITIGRYWYLSKRLRAVANPHFDRFEPIETESSGKVMAKSISLQGI